MMCGLHPLINAWHLTLGYQRYAVNYNNYTFYIAASIYCQLTETGFGDSDGQGSFKDRHCQHWYNPVITRLSSAQAE